MSKSPGHQKWPDHQVREQRLRERIQVKVNGEVIGESNDVIRVDEDGSPARFYFPRADVAMDHLQPTATMTQCPFKGTAHYFSVDAGGARLKDAVWTYEDPYDEHQTLKERLSFYDDRMPQIQIAPV
jgi:uncharacterized protein (DUF427 family)